MSRERAGHIEIVEGRADERGVVEQMKGEQEMEECRREGRVEEMRDGRAFKRVEGR